MERTHEHLRALKWIEAVSKRHCVLSREYTHSDLELIYLWFATLLQTKILEAGLGETHTAYIDSFSCEDSGGEQTFDSGS
jgi:hypothetical protein